MHYQISGDAWDIFVIGGKLTANRTNLMREEFPSPNLLIELLDGDGLLKLPRDLFFAPGGPLPRREGPSLSPLSPCYLK